MAGPPARLVTISFSCCCWARASSGDALKAPNKRKNVIRHTNAARRNMEYLRPRCCMNCRPGCQMKIRKNLRAKRPLRAIGATSETLPQPEGADGCAMPEAKSKFALDCVIGFA